MPAFAGWEYNAEYIGGGYYQEDGSRFTLAVRGGGSYGFASIKNKVGALNNEYYFDPNGDVVVTAAYYDTCVKEGKCAGFEYAGYGELSTLPASENYSKIAFAAGASIGWTLPYRPQWRLEAGWDHIAESDYNASPLFDGDLTLYGGAEGAPASIRVQSGAVEASLTMDIVSAMAFYDFFDGYQKPIGKMIPYVGLGLGYSSAKTILNLADYFGDLSGSVDLQNFGDMDEYGILQFYKSEKTQGNIAGLVAVGLSYGVTETMFFDFGLRAMYVPSVKWALTNSEGSRQRDWFSADSLMYINAMLGIRFEF